MRRPVTRASRNPFGRLPTNVMQSELSKYLSRANLVRLSAVTKAHSQTLRIAASNKKKALNASLSDVLKKSIDHGADRLLQLIHKALTRYRQSTEVVEVHNFRIGPSIQAWAATGPYFLTVGFFVRVDGDFRTNPGALPDVLWTCLVGTKNTNNAGRVYSLTEIDFRDRPTNKTSLARWLVRSITKRALAAYNRPGLQARV